LYGGVYVFPVIDLAVMVVQSLLMIIANPLFWFVLVLVYSQYKRNTVMEERILGVQKHAVRDRMVSSILAGMVGGVIGSIVMVAIGVTLDNTGILYVWVIAILLMTINPRYMCFSYAGGLVSLSALMFGFPNIDVSSLMAIVAILHLVESLLIFFNGHKHSIPIFIEHKGQGIVGGFNMVRFWPIPIILMTVMTGHVAAGETIPMPDWWPLLKGMGLEGSTEDAVFLMLPVVAALGYSDIAITEVPKNKSRGSAVRLLGYSLLLLAVSVTSSYLKPLQWAAAVLGPGLHEWLIIAGRRSQREGRALFAPSDTGVRVLDTLADSPASKMGIAPGDIIIRINGQIIDDEEGLVWVLSNYPTYIWMDVITLDGRSMTYEFKQYPDGIGRLGILTVPKDGKVPVAATEVQGILKRLLKMLKPERGE
jgi:hypothetical protein